MSRRLILPLLVAATLALAGCGVASAPFGSSVAAISAAAPVVASGRLVDYAAKPAAGVIILVNAWPKAPTASDLAARGDLHPIGWTRTGEDGSFEIRIAADDTLKGYATAGNNVVNFELTFFSGDAYPDKGIGAFGFSLPLTAEEGFLPAGALGDITVFP